MSELVGLRSYILCATPRSGSTMLCDLLTGSGVAGRPHSYYREQNIAEWASDLGVPAVETVGDREFDRIYLEAVRVDGSSANGVFGLRLMKGSLAGLLARLAGVFPDCQGEAALLERAFGPLVYLHLSRQDKVAQAVSRLRAEQGGLWHRKADGSERERTGEGQALVYEPERLAAFVDEAEVDDAAWEGFFAEHRITPVRLVYETLAAAPAVELGRVLTALGQDANLAPITPVKTAKLADAINLEWAQRFRAETGRR